MESVALNEAKSTLAIVPKFEQAALCASSTTFAKGALNRGFICQYGVELLSPFRMTEPSRVDFARPLYLASFMHTLLSQQRQRVMAPLSIKLPNVSSMEMAVLTTFALRNKLPPPSSWDELVSIRSLLTKAGASVRSSLDAEAYRVLEAVQRQDSGGSTLVAFWTALERLGFENALQDISLMAPEVLVAPESIMEDDARRLLGQLKEHKIVTQDADGFWIYTPGGSRKQKPIPLAFNDVRSETARTFLQCSNAAPQALLRPMFDIGSLSSYLRDSNVLLPRKLVLIGRSSEDAYASALSQARLPVRQQIFTLLNSQICCRFWRSWIFFRLWRRGLISFRSRRLPTRVKTLHLP